VLRGGATVSAARHRRWPRHFGKLNEVAKFPIGTGLIALPTLLVMESAARTRIKALSRSCRHKPPFYATDISEHPDHPVASPMTDALPRTRWRYAFHQNTARRAFRLNAKPKERWP
jgi:hypothetical protein